MKLPLKFNKLSFYWNGTVSALGFLTILPVATRGVSNNFNGSQMVPFFPIVGIIIGIMLAIFDAIVLLFWSQHIAAILDIIFLAVISGALHLDGLGDAADGLFSHKSREQALEIMKDSRVGIMGLLAVIFALLIKCAAIMELEAHRGLILILVPAYARASMIFGIRYLNYGRPEGGTGLNFFENPQSLLCFSGLLLLFGLSLFLGFMGIWLNIIFIGLTGAILLFFKLRMECITGDMLGAMCELLESLLLLSMVAL